MAKANHPAHPAPCFLHPDTGMKERVKKMPRPPVACGGTPIFCTPTYPGSWASSKSVSREGMNSKVMRIAPLSSRTSAKNLSVPLPMDGIWNTKLMKTSDYTGVKEREIAFVVPVIGSGTVVHSRQPFPLDRVPRLGLWQVRDDGVRLEPRRP